MRILHVTETLKGGIASYLDEIALFQSQRYGAANVRFFLPRGWGLDTVNIAPAQVTDFAVFRRRSPRSWISYCLALVKTLNAVKPDVVHLHSTIPGGIGRLVCMFRGEARRTVYQPHGWCFEIESGRFLRLLFGLLERLLAGLGDSIIVFSDIEVERAMARGIPRSRLVVVRTGIADNTVYDVEHTLQADRRINLLYVGRLDRQKGVDNLFGVMRLLQRRDLSLTVIGSSVLRGARFTAPEDAITVDWRPRGDLLAHFVHADAVVIPSRWEGMPIVALEAIRAGTPVICSGVGSLPEVITHGQTGFIVDFAKHAEAVSFLEVLSLQELRRMRAACRQRFVDEFGSLRMNEKLDQLYGRFQAARGVAMRPTEV